MPVGPRGPEYPADVICNAYTVAQTETGEIEEKTICARSVTAEARVSSFNLTADECHEIAKLSVEAC
ncbi:hypothetical protein SAMN04515647_3792 [Cohaesibacter sp. ES.047]|nr:hypothetical protein SAMN04515647_3792 [Cohaesibacter sp. ES.047]